MITSKVWFQPRLSSRIRSPPLLSGCKSGLRGQPLMRHHEEDTYVELNCSPAGIREASRLSSGAVQIGRFSMPESLLFLTELLGLSVYDLKGRRIGRVRDSAIV